MPTASLFLCPQTSLDSMIRHLGEFYIISVSHTQTHVFCLKLTVRSRVSMEILSLRHASQHSGIFVHLHLKAYSQLSFRNKQMLSPTQ